MTPQPRTVSTRVYSDTRIRRGIIGVLIALLLTLVGCESSPPPPTVQVVEGSRTAIAPEIETVRLNNCGGKAVMSQSVERGTSTSIQGGAELRAKGVALEGAVTAQYTQGTSHSKNLTLSAPPDTYMEFTVQWAMEEYQGQIQEVGHPELAAPYRYVEPLTVEVLHQQDFGCVQAAPPLPSPTSPSPPTVPPTVTAPAVGGPAPSYADITAHYNQLPEADRPAYLAQLQGLQVTNVTGTAFAPSGVSLIPLPSPFIGVDTDGNLLTPEYLLLFPLNQMPMVYHGQSVTFSGTITGVMCDIVCAIYMDNLTLVTH